MREPQPASTDNPKGSPPWEIAAESTATALWYAMPDFVPSRARRAALKTALLAGAGAYGLSLGRGLDNDHSSLDVAGPETAPSDGEALRQGIMIVAAGAALVSGAVILERFIQRSAHRLGERGVKYPNTVMGLALGALTALAQKGIRRATGNRAQLKG